MNFSRILCFVSAVLLFSANVQANETFKLGNSDDLDRLDSLKLHVSENVDLEVLNQMFSGDRPVNISLLAYFKNTDGVQTTINSAHGQGVLKSAKHNELNQLTVTPLDYLYSLGFQEGTYTFAFGISDLESNEPLISCGQKVAATLPKKYAVTEYVLNITDIDANKGMTCSVEAHEKK